MPLGGAERRQLLRDWRLLITSPPGGERRVLLEVERLLRREGFGATRRATLGSGFLGLRRKPVIRVKLRDVEAEIAAQASGPRLLMTWSLYHRSSLLGRFFSRGLSEPAALELQAFADHTLGVMQSVATGFATDQSEPDDLPASGDLGPL